MFAKDLPHFGSDYSKRHKLGRLHVLKDLWIFGGLFLQLLSPKLLKSSKGGGRGEGL